jgi:hypothetical protein
MADLDTTVPGKGRRRTVRVPKAKKTTPPEAMETTQAFWEDLDALWESVPDEELAKLPPDLSAEIDHYVYGLPKRNP